MADRHWVGGNGTWDASDTTHWSTTKDGAGGASVPVSTDNVYLDSDSPASITLTGSLTCLNFNSSAPLTGNTTISGGAGNLSVYGNWVTHSTFSFNASSVHFGVGASNYTINANGAFISWIQFDSNKTGSLLSDISYNTWWINSTATLDALAANLTGVLFDSTGAAGKTVNMGTGVWRFNNTSTVGTYMVLGVATLNPGTARLEVSCSNTGNWDFDASSSKSISEFKVIDVAGSGAIIFNQTVTFTTFRAQVTNAKTVRFHAGSTYTATNWFSTGAAGQLLTLKSTTDTSAWNLIKSGGGTVSADYLSLRDSAATPGSTWYAGTHSTNVSGNTGWIFTDPPVTNVRPQINIFM